MAFEANREKGEKGGWENVGQGVRQPATARHLNDRGTPMNFRPGAFALVLLMTLAGCSPGKPLASRSESLADARTGVASHAAGARSGDPVEGPPPNTVRIVSYQSATGKLVAYLSPQPRDGKRHPAIVWITGDDCAGKIHKDTGPTSSITLTSEEASKLFGR